MTNLKLCIAQTSPRTGPETVPERRVFAPLEDNLKLTGDLVVRARSEGADVVVFPEYWLQGIVQDREYLVHPAPYLIQHLQELAKQHNIAICGTIVEPKDHMPIKEPSVSPFAHLRVGNLEGANSDWTEYIRQVYASPESTTTNDDTQRVREGDSKDLPTKGPHSDGPEKTEQVETMINVAYVIEGGTGDIVGRYVKKNLWISERDYLTSGEDEHEVFELNGIKMGLLICWDLAHSGAAGALAKQGVDVILAPTYWTATDSEPASNEFDPSPDYEHDLLQALCQTRAFETETALVMCNAGGPHSAGFAGGSGVWAPFKGQMKGRPVETSGCDDRGEGYDPVVRIYEIELGRLLKVARETYQIRQDWEKQDSLT